MKWIHRAERIVNLRRRGATPAESMYAWRRASKFWRAMLFVLARPVTIIKARDFSPLKVFQSFFNRRTATRLVRA